MDSNTWSAVDAYLESHFTQADPVMEAALALCEAQGLPPIQVAPCHGKLLHILALSIRAERILEIGTLGGYSTIWFARALSAPVCVVSIEHNAKHAAVARQNVEAAGFADRVEIREGAALAVLDALIEAGAAPFDLVFLDADKENNPNYLERVLKLVRRGALIVCDNIVRNGKIVDPDPEEAQIRGQQAYCARLRAEAGLVSTAVQTVGRKGYDGFAISVVTGLDSDN